MKLLMDYYLLGLNLTTFVVYGIDKWKARKNKWRISERCLLFMALAGGSVGAWTGMKVWRHKTRHRKFRYGLPAIIVLQLMAVVWYEIKMGKDVPLLNALFK